MARRAGRSSGPSARTGWPAAPAGRLHVVQPDARPRRADHLGVRRRASSPRRPATLWDLTVDYPGMLLAVAGTAVPGHGRGHQRPGRAAPAALRVVAPAAPLRLPRRRPGPAAPAVDRPGVPRLAGRDRLLVDAVGRWPPAAVLVWRVGAAAVAQPAAPAAGHLGGPRGRRRRLGLPDRPPTCTGCRSRPASSSPGGSSAGPAGPAANPYSLSAAPDGRSLRITVKDARRRQRRARARCGPAPGCWSRARTAGSAARARTRRKVALIGAGVGITPLRALAEGLRLRPGRRGPAAALHRPSRSSPASSTCSPRERGLQVLTLPGPPALAGLLARRRRRRRSTTWPPCGYWVPDIAERDVYVCGPEAWTETSVARP